MRVLAFDTATRATIVAFTDTERGVSFEGRDDPPPAGRPGHTERLLTLCHEVLVAAGIGWSELDLMAVGIGPGTFTGLRIGIATAHALTQSTGVPLIGISTLDSLVLGAEAAARNTAAPGAGRQAPLAVIDARRGEAFVGAAGRLAPAVVPPADLARIVSAARAQLAVGDGAVLFRAELEAAGATVPPDASPLHRASAIHHCTLAAGLTPGTPTDVQPLYLRIPDAELSLTAADGR